MAFMKDFLDLTNLKLMVIYPTYLMFFIAVQSKVQSSPKCQPFMNDEKNRPCFQLCGNAFLG